MSCDCEASRATLPLVDRNDQVLGFGFPHELRDDLDLLPTCENVADRHPCHTGHLSVVVDAHQLVHQPEWQVRLLA